MKSTYVEIIFLRLEKDPESLQSKKKEKKKIYIYIYM
jgi:hypothetical protein